MPRMGGEKKTGGQDGSERKGALDPEQHAKVERPQQ